MPDHIHLIIIINETKKNQKSINRNDDAVTSSFNDNDSLTGMVDPLYTTDPFYTTDLQQPSTNIGNRDINPNNTGGTKNMHFSSISPSSGSLATIIRSYKSAVTFRARCIEPGFAWQSKFYDHILRTNAALARIRTYIKNNPSRWGK
jgi:REP element-mobilizing transposase RayT